MKNKPLLIALIIPILFIAHVLEEYFGGFVQFHRDLLNSDLSDGDFFTITFIAFIIADINAVMHSIKQGSNYFTAVIGTLLALNGVVHVLLSIIMTTYAPGAVSGLILFIPLGFVLYKHIYPLLTLNQQRNAITAAIIAHLVITFFASSM